MNNIKWLVQIGIFGDEDVIILDTLDKLKQEYKTIKYISTDTPTPYDNENNVIFVGSTLACKRIQQQKTWNPGAIVTWPNYFSSYYHKKFPGLMLNTDNDFTALYNLLSNYEYFFRTYGIDNTIFIRPDDGDKIFTACRMYKEAWSSLVEQVFNYNDVPLDTSILVSSPKHIQEEYRFFMHELTPITGSLYKKDG